MALAQTAPPKPNNPAPPKPADQTSPFGGFFAKKSAKPAPKTQGPPGELAETVSNVVRRLRIIESRYDNMRKKLQFIEQNMLEANRKLNQEIKANTLGMVEVKRGFMELQDRMRMVVKEVQLRAQKEDVDIIKKYLQYWEPIKFVTTDQVDEIIDQKLDERK